MMNNILFRNTHIFLNLYRNPESWHINEFYSISHVAEDVFYQTKVQIYC